MLETEGMIVESYPDRLYGALAFIAGDNLNIHMLGGFNACFSPNVRYPRRFCMAYNIMVQEVDDADSLELRTIQKYDSQVIEIAQDASKCQLCGIRYSSPFISGSFHVIDGVPQT
jgi:hypothetical protein